MIACYDLKSVQNPIPNFLNSVLSIFVFTCCVTLLIFGSRVSGPGFFLVGLTFAFLFLTNYAFLHEASHFNLHSNLKINDALGFLTGLLFPISFSLFKVTHQGHHLRNRTDFEMFDLIYPEDQNKLWRRIQWYGTLCGTFWMVIALSNFVFIFCPGLLKTKIFKKDRSSSYLVLDIERTQLKTVQREIGFCFLFFAALFFCFNLDAKRFFLMYLMAGINWSTRQYVGHAYTKRDVIEGAINLKTNRFLTWVLLNGNWDLNHHRRPDVSWIHLPKLGEMSQTKYLAAYLRMWTGPRLTVERGPEALANLPLLVHE